MEKCTTPGCGNTVSKAGFKLCLGCWKKQRAGGGKQKAAAKASSPERGGLLTATEIGKHFGLKAARVNALLNELGWIARGTKGWHPTYLGEAIGAEQRHIKQSGVPYTLWTPEVLKNNILIAAIKEHLGESAAAAPQEAAAAKPDADDFRSKFPATLRTSDGHLVRSKAEVLIDNYLYTAGIVHAYERKLPVEENLYCDFYIPAREQGQKVYVEYWGLENEPAYRKRKEAKLAIYRKYELNLIELRDDEVQNLDDHMPRLLLPFGITVE